ncbi:pyridoxamine 5'-phosphate oxidase-like fmn-binding protein [Advenella kashmirensis WT001]|uniref:Pyridoxamine 5'-phosphate oxidase-like fmn-binding protein n=1 Tax=Advenella kashmirensis (strain DSM 17095 / LMG 22695 / WT001) TaxID=1036672 RepID=I3UFK4_ADVKW|nr:pyridoxamine 5'-phosphate oxidase family protein [Advenella kashmirensis]AFK63792.1 pyridoxamine 5'-phosphate oxidase-like fmn-binding protein [Advenella kashmirensis WT001]
MQELYGKQHRALQQDFDTVKLADAVNDNIVCTEIGEEHRGFIESREMFFLTTIDHRGYPTCSYKGGNPGFLKIIDSKTLAFPSFDGNGMFLSMGNISINNQVGMLLINFDIPHRIRIHGNASIHRDEESLKMFQGAEIVVFVDIVEMFVNCARYIHRYKRVASAKHVPQDNVPVALPHWKRIEGLQEALPARDKQIADILGGTITPEQYAEMLSKGET